MKRSPSHSMSGRVLACLLALLLCAGLLGGCSAQARWQEQYDLGMRYLNEGKYEEAILAFEAAIKIDPKNPAAYLGAGDAHLAAAALAEDEQIKREHLEKALEMYQKGQELGDATAADKVQQTQTEYDQAVCTHEWAEANYQQPKTCVKCAKTEGEPLEAALTAYTDLTVMQVDTAYDYRTLCFKDNNYSTTGQVTVTDYKVFSSDETHPSYEGYEWRSFVMDFVYTDDAAWEYGHSTRTHFVDYYTGDSYRRNDDSSLTFLDDLGENYQAITVSYNGEEWDAALMGKIISSDEWVDHTFHVTILYEAFVPEGYDGFSVAAYNSVHESVVNGESNLLSVILSDPETLYFRAA